MDTYIFILAVISILSMTMLAAFTIKLINLVDFLNVRSSWY